MAARRTADPPDWSGVRDAARTKRRATLFSAAGARLARDVRSMPGQARLPASGLFLAPGSSPAICLFPSLSGKDCRSSANTGGAVFKNKSDVKQKDLNPRKKKQI